MRLADIGDPITHGLVDGLLERALAGFDAADFGAHEAHTVDVQSLALHVGRAHVDDALEAETGADRRGRGTVLAGAGLGDDALLAHADGEQRLADDVVDLVGAGVEHVLAFEVDAGAADMLGQRLGVVKSRGASGVIPEHVSILLLEDGIATGLVIGLGQVQERGHQRLRDIHSAELTETAAGVRHAEARFGGRDEAGGRHGDACIKREPAERASDKGF